MAESYRGRFAPSPTGPLHFGSLVAAVGSWLDARRAGGKWLVRIEDIDEMRCVPGADSEILRTLEAYALEWDEEVVWQTTRHALYRAALESLGTKVFPCSCARKPRYDGACRNGTTLPHRSIRLRVADEVIQFEDRGFGTIQENLTVTCGDFILRRADGLYAYQLAVVVDDAEQRITDIVRGAESAERPSVCSASRRQGRAQPADAGSAAWPLQAAAAARFAVPSSPADPPRERCR